MVRWACLMGVHANGLRRLRVTPWILCRWSIVCTPTTWPRGPLALHWGFGIFLLVVPGRCVAEALIWRISHGSWSIDRTRPVRLILRFSRALTPRRRPFSGQSQDTNFPAGKDKGKPTVRAFLCGFLTAHLGPQMTSTETSIRSCQGTA